jgi:methyltransferase (TIGR00027 family)
VAVRRAAHQLFDQPRVLDDPLALPIIGIAAAEKLRTSPKTQSSIARAFRAFMAVRSRYAEDQLAQAVARGTRQYVVLGAGLDTFAYRNPYPGLRVFEVDHPATQEWKRGRLQAAGIAVPSSMIYAAVDFERQTLAWGLEQSGFDPKLPAFFSWLGVVPYLTRESCMATLSHIAKLPAGQAWLLILPLTRSCWACDSVWRFMFCRGGWRQLANPFNCSFVRPNSRKNSRLWALREPRYWEHRKSTPAISAIEPTGCG